MCRNSTAACAEVSQIIIRRQLLARDDTLRYVSLTDSERYRPGTITDSGD